MKKTVIWLMIQRWQMCFRGEMTEIQSELLFFRMETSDIVAIGALAISFLALIGTGYSLRLQKQANERERRKEEREHRAALVSLKIRLSKHSTFNNKTLIMGRPSDIPINCFLLNDGGKTIYLRNLRLQGKTKDNNWKEFDKKNFLNGVKESVIEPGPEHHLLLKAKLTAEQISILEEFNFRVQVITTSNETYYSEVIDVNPIRFSTR